MNGVCRLALLAGAEEPADDGPQALEEVAVDDGEDALGHLHGADAAGHLGDGPEGHIVVEQQVQVGLALLDALVDEVGEDLVGQPPRGAFGVVHLAQRVVHVQHPAPVAVGDGAAQ